MSGLIKKQDVLDELKKLLGLSQDRALRELTVRISHDSPYIELDVTEFATRPETEPVQ